MKCTVQLTLVIKVLVSLAEKKSPTYLLSCVRSYQEDITWTEFSEYQMRKYNSFSINIQVSIYW